MSFDPATFHPKHFLWEFNNGVATITLNRPERKNPLTFESYDELRDTFRALDREWRGRAIVLPRAGGGFFSGGGGAENISPPAPPGEGGGLHIPPPTARPGR